MKNAYVAVKERGNNINGYLPVSATFGYVIISAFLGLLTL
jgi:hypothetical protein